MRLFFGLPLPEGVRDDLARLRGDVGRARWIPASELHLTLRFVGDVEERVAAELAVRATRSWSSPAIALRGVGVFGSLERARVLWVGAAPDPALSALAADLETIARQCGLAPEERAFAAHLTLARLKQSRPAALKSFLREHEHFELPSFRAAELVLFESRLGAEGASYHAWSRLPLVQQ